MAPRLLLPLAMLFGATSLIGGCGGGGGGGSGGGDPSPPPGNPPPSGGVAIAGSLLVAAVSQADSDVNDPNAPYVANDTRGQAQRLATPVALGGYVNQPGRGSSGRSFAMGDVDDVFHACDDGEACGAYPVEPEPTIVNVAGTAVDGIDFTTAFRTNVDADR